MSDHYDRYNGMENLLSTNLAEVSTDVPDINVGELISSQAELMGVAVHDSNLHAKQASGLELQTYRGFT